MNKIKGFLPPSVEDVQERFHEHGALALTDEDVATILGALEARTDRLKCIRQVAANYNVPPNIRLNDILDLTNNMRN